jgi:hypothetical protein
MNDTDAFRLQHSKKVNFFDFHQRFLPSNHSFRNDTRSYLKGKTCCSFHFRLACHKLYSCRTCVAFACRKLYCVFDDMCVILLYSLPILDAPHPGKLPK